MNDEKEIKKWPSFRLLTKDEVEVRVGSINSGGVSLLLYKDARVDQTLLDETVGPMNWQRHHSRENANCVVSIRNPETGEWIEKEDTGKESNTEAEKGLASDSFKRACFNWGIGRELYSAPQMFIFKDKVQGLDTEKRRCNSTFKVTALEYSGREISRVQVAAIERGKEYARFDFTNSINKPEPKASATPAPATKEAAPTAKPATADTTKASAPIISDDEIILIGNCKGKKYGDVKGTNTFTLFMKWIANADTSYPNANQQRQYEAFKKMAKEAC